MSRVKEWVIRNAVAVVLVGLFTLIFVVSQRMDDSSFYYGTTGIQYLNGEYYRFLTCLFLHYNIRHLLANSIALLSVSSLLSPFLKNGQALFLFLIGGILSEIAFSVVITERLYDIGASSGIFALIACLLVCELRFQKQVRRVWYRPDVIVVLIYFVFANTSTSSFLVHTFGFATGTLLGFSMVTAGLIKPPNQHMG